MKSLSRRFVPVLMVSALAVSPAVAETFGAADLLFVPAAGHTEGAEDSVWATDLTITNVDEAPVDVAIFFLPGGGGNNADRVDDRSTGLGGDEAQGWGYVDERLAGIQPNGSVTIDDVVNTWITELGALASNGGLVIFSWESGTLDDTSGRILRNVMVTSRTYNTATILVPDEDSEDEDPPPVEVEATFGQQMPGIPWYQVIDAGAVDEDSGVDLTVVELPGAAVSADFRYNVGFLNTSDRQTSVRLRVIPYDTDGNQLVDDEGGEIARLVTLAELSHNQQNNALATWFNQANVSDITLRIEFDSWTSSNPIPVPSFLVYGSLIDNRSNDPTTYLASYLEPFDIDCQFPSNTGDGTDGGRQLAPLLDPATGDRVENRRWLHLPPR